MATWEWLVLGLQPLQGFGGDDVGLYAVGA